MRKRLHEKDYRRFGPYETEIREKRKFPLIPFILAVVLCIFLIFLIVMLVSAAEIQQIQVKIDDEDWRNVSIGEHVSFNTGKKDVDLYFKIDYPTEIEINVFGLEVFDLKNVTKEEDYIFTTHSTDFSLHFTVKEKANKSFIFLRGNNGKYPLIVVVVSYTQYNPPSVDEMISEARDNIQRLRYDYHCFDLAERLEDALNSAGNNEYKIRKVWEETNEEVNKREDIEREIEKLEKRAYSLEDEKLRELILAEIKDAKLDLKDGKSLEYLNAEIQHINSLFGQNSVNWLLLVIAPVLASLILCLLYIIKWLKGG